MIILERLLNWMEAIEIVVIIEKRCNSKTFHGVLFFLVYSTAITVVRQVTSCQSVQKWKRMWTRELIYASNVVQQNILLSSARLKWLQVGSQKLGFTLYTIVKKRKDLKQICSVSVSNEDSVHVFHPDKLCSWKKYIKIMSSTGKCSLYGFQKWLSEICIMCIVCWRWMGYQWSSYQWSVS